MTHVRVLERDGDGRAAVVESEIDATVARVRVRLRFSYDEPVAVRWTRESGDLRSLTGSWRFEKSSDGMTLATYALEIGVGRRLAVLVRTVRGPVRNRIEALLADRPVQGLKIRAEMSAWHPQEAGFTSSQRWSAEGAPPPGLPRPPSRTSLRP
jgi:hypothetical protein